MAIKDELIKLDTTKKGIKTVLQEKGVEVAGKSFTDTPALIGQMSVEKGDEVEAFAISEAKHARVGDKVILNYAANMLPGERKVTSGANSTYNNTFTGIYCDKDSIYIGGIFPDSGGNYKIGYFERDVTGGYIYKGSFRPSYLPNTACLFKIFSCERVICIFNKMTYSEYGPQNFSDYGGITYSSDFQYIASAGSNPRLYKQIDGVLTLLSDAFPIEMPKTFCGFGIVGKNLLTCSGSNLYTYSFDKDGLINKIGSSSVQGLNRETYFWRFFDGDTKVVIVRSTELMIYDVTFDSSVYSMSKNTELTGLIQSYLVNAGISSISNIIIVEDKDIYVWGNGGLAVMRYETNTLKPIASPFPDLIWNNRFFINPIDKIAITQISATEIYVRVVDAPIAQKYIATKAWDGLQFQSVSLSGFVKENKSGILKVTTVVDPNAIVPTYRDTFGLKATVKAGAIDAQQFDMVGSPIITNKIATNFSDSNYLTFKSPFKTGMHSFEVVTCFNSTDLTVPQAGLYDGDTNLSEQMIRFTVTPDGKIRFRANSNTSAGTYLVDLTGTTPLLPDTKYWAKATYDNQTGYKLWLSTNKTDYTEEASNANTTLMAIANQADIIIGDNVVAGSSFQGQIFLDECYINVDGQRVWTAFGLDKGSINISWGWFKSGNDYVKWSGTPAATLAHVEGNKARKMSLWLVKDGDATKPVISTLEPTSYTVRHKVDDVYLSDTLDYFIEAPQSESEVDNV